MYLNDILSCFDLEVISLRVMYFPSCLCLFSRPFLWLACVFMCYRFVHFWFVFSFVFLCSFFFFFPLLNFSRLHFGILDLFFAFLLAVSAQTLTISLLLLLYSSTTPHFGGNYCTFSFPSFYLISNFKLRSPFSTA